MFHLLPYHETDSMWFCASCMQHVVPVRVKLTGYNLCILTTCSAYLLLMSHLYNIKMNVLDCVQHLSLGGVHNSGNWESTIDGTGTESESTMIGDTEYWLSWTPGCRLFVKGVVRTVPLFQYSLPWCAESGTRKNQPLCADLSHAESEQEEGLSQ